jgi:hypothetical protein
VISVILVAILAGPGSHASTGQPFTDSNNAVNNGFSSIYYAEQNGGDVSALVAKLNTAISLIQTAKAENTTNPSAATNDLSNATNIAQNVSLTASSVSSSGLAARNLHLYESTGTAATTIAVAALTYLKGDLVYRRLWLYVYRNHVVKKNDE